jgi:hypothetical protein
MNGKDQRLSPRLLQIVGIVMLLGAFAFWTVTGHQSALWVGAALSLIGAGELRRMVLWLLENMGPERPRGKDDP